MAILIIAELYLLKQQIPRHNTTDIVHQAPARQYLLLFWLVQSNNGVLASRQYAEFTPVSCITTWPTEHLGTVAA